MADVKQLHSNKTGNSTRQLTTYALIGVVSNLLGYLLYLVITHSGVPPKMAMTFLYFFGAAAGFWGNRRLTFSHQGKILGAGLRYFFAHCLGYMLNFLILEIGVTEFGYAHQWVQAVAIFAVAAYLFVASKYFVFAKPAAKLGSHP